MAQRKKINDAGSHWLWINFMAFLLVLILLILSAVENKSPGDLLSSWFINKSSEKALSDLSRDQLLDLVTEKDSIILALEDRIEDLRKDRALVRMESSNLNMRSMPSIEAPILVKIPRHSIVTIIEYDDKEYIINQDTGRWCKVLYSGKEGWVWSNYLQRVDN